ncbi:hypothetical protein MDV086.2 [Gallid alphaherpesvirus 2]|uniref:Uncharacterized protein n=1 Tax=Gallid alphaherpesvirus 2 TaxID=10390 RepID=Q19B37_9ALPH|nr:hypothetical protein MDV086.2 [Gallid alphaherpesvirus 2]
MQTRCCRGKKRGTVPFSTQMGPPPPKKKKEPCLPPRK